ncbi:AAEL004721-PA [Aedes aegypti]|uniref:AAEL004721-PA n=1 Tax=Aedes aegypti TaxID=7159 RepID=Q17C47_AEDAE|nr:AAEL004721-PA [Aedes aegypti]
MPPPFPIDSSRECFRKARRTHSAANYVIHLCRMECYYTELGIMSDDTLYMDKVKEYLEKVEDPAREFYETVFQTCDDELMTRNNNFAVAVCSSYAALLEKCVEEKKKQQCPMEYSKKSM